MPIALATTIIPLILTVAVIILSTAGAGVIAWGGIAVMGALALFVFVEFLRVTRDLDEH
ncbi:MAG TPA: hypothetical protein VIG06_23095 [Kofleriaceae bacterium]|jgi:hypothetical protein